MKAAMRDRYGPPSVVEIRELTTPAPANDEVLVRVRAASLNRSDLDGLYPRWQFTRLFSGLRRPKVKRLGLDMAGIVEAVGPAVTQFSPGDRVFADLYAFGQGAFAEYVCVPERALGHMPEGLSFEAAAAIPHSAVLALQGLRLRDGRTIAAGDRVLIEGASGNVGPFAVQIAKAMGAVVTGVCRTDKVDFVRSLGADHVIDYTAVDYTTTGERYEWIVAVEAHHSLLRSFRALAPGGAYVAHGASTAWLLSSILITPAISWATDRWAGLLMWWKPFDPPDVERIAALIATGQVRPIIDRTFPLDQIVEALTYVDEGRASGKVVISMSGSDT